ncbi:helix-turn-helix domain-containing protein [Rathayibacter sp. PhB151]|uniref:helix-turn-helix transcriptional regulator n=1 Tax=Rathayibacter sp. PhB151 TaxID=2485189 RepID=UPI00141704E3|nr:helix-turn-helix domain-containing protein [Rathayibacter sp. PhB151]
MAATTSRALALLALLQTHRQWSGPVLAARLGVTERTLRRDIEQLRELGYAVAATRGALGGYRLEPGSRVPPRCSSATTRPWPWRSGSGSRPTRGSPTASGRR